MLRVCQVCGVTFEGRPAALKCPKCADLSKRSVIRPRTCRQCGQTFPGGPRAWYCPRCREERTRERDRRHKRQGPVRHLGDIDLCIVCGKPYIVKSGRQKYCPDCAPAAVREIDRAQAAEWAAANTTPEGRWLARHAASAELVCPVCGKTFRQDPRRAPAKTCSPECSKEYHRRQAAQFDTAHREERSAKARERRQKKLAAMTPKELAAHQEAVNARARENYRKCKERQAQAPNPPTQAPD